MVEPLTFVVEGSNDAAILRKLLPELFAGARFFAANGQTSVATLARNLLVHEGAPVMVVADSDTQDMDRARENRNLITAALRQVSSDTRFDVFLFSPMIEVIFLESPTELPGLEPISTVSEMSKIAPKMALQMSVRGGSVTNWQQQLQQSDWEQIRQGCQAKALIEAASNLLQVSTASV